MTCAMTSRADTPTTEAERIEDWRETQLLHAGYPPDDAIELSRLAHVDVHLAAALVDAGCPVPVAVEILR